MMMLIIVVVLCAGAVAFLMDPPQEKVKPAWSHRCKTSTGEPDEWAEMCDQGWRTGQAPDWLAEESMRNHMAWDSLAGLGEKEGSGGDCDFNG